jgi:hypothetical protein
MSLTVTRASDVATKAQFGRWNGWQRTKTTNELVYQVDRNYRYRVDLDTCTTRAEVLDWLCQVHGKNWATDECLSGLVRALIDLTHPRRLPTSTEHWLQLEPMFPNVALRP